MQIEIHWWSHEDGELHQPWRPYREPIEPPPMRCGAIYLLSMRCPPYEDIGCPVIARQPDGSYDVDAICIAIFKKWMRDFPCHYAAEGDHYLAIYRNARRLKLPYVRFANGIGFKSRSHAMLAKLAS